MKDIRKLLLLFSATPVIIILLISILNINKPVRIKILTWTTPPIGLGILMTIGSFTGAVITASSINTLNSQNSEYKREVRLDPNSSRNDSDPLIENENTQMYNSDEFETNNDLNTYIPERDIRDPTPTVSVPFRVINSSVKYTKPPIPSNNQSTSFGLEDQYENHSSEQEISSNQIFDEEEDQILENTNQGIIDDWGRPSSENWY